MTIRKTVKITTSPSLPQQPVAYAIFGNRCVFTADYDACYGSSINFAEGIIAAIAAQEQVPIRSLRFFDLQTHIGYESKKPGTFEYDEIIFTVYEGIRQSWGRKLDVESWLPSECPQEVQEFFAEQIGTLPANARIWTIEEALKEGGFAPTKMHSPTTGSCFEYVRCAGSMLDLFCEMNPAMQSMVEPLAADSDCIVVDHGSNVEHLEKSKGHRYCVWSRRAITKA